jgi:hypothetical protein
VRRAWQLASAPRGPRRGPRGDARPPASFATATVPRQIIGGTRRTRHQAQGGGSADIRLRVEGLLRAVCEECGEPMRLVVVTYLRIVRPHRDENEGGRTSDARSDRGEVASVLRRIGAARPYDALPQIGEHRRVGATRLRVVYGPRRVQQLVAQEKRHHIARRATAPPRLRSRRMVHREVVQRARVGAVPAVEARRRFLDVPPACPLVAAAAHRVGLPAGANVLREAAAHLLGRGRAIQKVQERRKHVPRRKIADEHDVVASEQLARTRRAELRLLSAGAAWSLGRRPDLTLPTARRGEVVEALLRGGCSREFDHRFRSASIRPSAHDQLCID